MLFLPESVYEARRKLMADFQAGKIGEQQMYARMLELYADDDIALVGIGQSRLNEGDLRGAEDCFWRAINAHPFHRQAYMHLSLMLDKQPGQQDLSTGLTELALRKFLLDDEAVEQTEDLKIDFDPLVAGLLKNLNAPDQIGAVTQGMFQMRAAEPDEVTERLRPYRLIHDLQEAEDLDTELVDAFLAEGETIVPLLVGVLRGWAQDYVEDDAEWSVENALALLGEIGDATVIPHLLEFIVRDNHELAGAARWAFDRIVELHPERAAEVLDKIAADVEGAERIAIAERLLRFRALDRWVRIFERLAENVGQIPKVERGEFFPILLTTMIAAHGPRGVEMARASLRHNADLLSRKTRAECDELITTLAARSLPPLPNAEPSEWTVYDICRGEAAWDEDEEEDGDLLDEEPDEMFLAPEPVQKPATPGRNEPCWCGSGKKYKKCHLDADQKAGRGGESVVRGEIDKLRSRIGEFMTEVSPVSESRGALQEFFGGEDPGDDQMAFIDWMIHDRPLPRSGRTAMEEFLRRHGSHLTPWEREFVQFSAESFVGLYEVQEVETGRGITVKDLIVHPGETFLVHDVSLSNQMVRWDGLLARVIHGERGLEFSGVGLPVPRRQLEEFREWMVEDRRRTGLPWPEYLKHNLPRIRRRLNEICEEWRESLQLSNSDGEELLVSNAVYRILDEAAVSTALKNCPELHEDGPRFTWLRSAAPGDAGNTVLGSIRIQGEQLTLDCNSRQRMERGKSLLADLAGPYLKHLRDEFTSQQELKRRAKEQPRTSKREPDPIPPEVQRQVIAQVMERSFREWPDKHIPALDGMTPREAVKTPAGRKRVAALLRDFENAEEHKRRAGKYSYDIDRLRAELGIT